MERITGVLRGNSLVPRSNFTSKAQILLYSSRPGKPSSCVSLIRRTAFSPAGTLSIAPLIVVPSGILSSVLSTVTLVPAAFSSSASYSSSASCSPALSSGRLSLFFVTRVRNASAYSFTNSSGAYASSSRSARSPATFSSPSA